MKAQFNRYTNQWTLVMLFSGLGFFLMPGYVWLFLALLGFSLFVSVMFLDGFVYG
jgi:hypothetical protein